jgi:TM2 domain-containing membrane protein YozV/Tfp pilus assembly major pilin PilA
MVDMVHCRGCGADIHRTAASCPKCGATQRTQRQKSKVAAGVLALLLGGLGIHRFYLGQWWGIFYLLFFWTWIPGLIALVEGIVFLCSSQEGWDAKYNDGIPSQGGSSAGVVIVCIVGAFVFIAVIGILAAIAIPAYQDYTIRAQITEGLNLAAEPKAAIAEAILRQGKVPRDRGNAGLTPNATDSSGLYVQSIGVHNGRIDITYGNRANARIVNHVVSLTPYLERHGESNPQVVWRCAYAPVPVSATDEVSEYEAGTVEPKFLPRTCRA